MIFFRKPSVYRLDSQTFLKFIFVKEKSHVDFIPLSPEVTNPKKPENYAKFNPVIA